MKTRRNVFTTGEVAKICQCAPRTVSQWIDRGTLRGWRIPGSNDRRVARESLLRFLREHGFPAHILDAASPPILLVGTPGAVLAACQQDAPHLSWLYAPDPFAAGCLFAEHHPGVVVIDAGTLGRHTAAGLAAAMRCTEVQLIAVAAEDGPPPGEWDAVLAAPAQASRLLVVLEGA